MVEHFLAYLRADKLTGLFTKHGSRSSLVTLRRSLPSYGLLLLQKPLAHRTELSYLAFGTKKPLIGHRTLEHSPLLSYVNIADCRVFTCQRTALTRGASWDWQDCQSTRIRTIEITRSLKALIRKIQRRPMNALLLKTGVQSWSYWRQS